MKKFAYLCFLFALIAILKTGGAAHASTFDLIATSYDMPPILFEVHPSSGNQTVLSSLSLNEKVGALDWNQQTNRLYGASAGRIIEIDPLTGIQTFVAPIQKEGLDVWVSSLAFAPNGTLYGWSDSGKEIGMIDLNTGNFSSVFSTPFDIFSVMIDFSPNGDLYAVYRNNDSQTLVAIDMYTLSVFNEKKITSYLVDDIDYAPDGFIYHSNYSHALMRMDPVDANQFIVGYGEFALKGIASKPVPIPGAVWFLGSGLVGLTGIRKKKFAK